MPRPTDSVKSTFKLFDNLLSAAAISLTICIVLTYALSAFIYFTAIIIESKEEDVFYVQGVAVQNITYAIAALFTTYAFIRLLDRKIIRNWVKYLCIALLNFLIILVLRQI